MRILKKDKLLEFIKSHPDAEQGIRAWVDVARSAMFVEEIVRSFRQAKRSQTGIIFQVSLKPYFLFAQIKSPAIFIEKMTVKPFKTKVSRD